MKIKQCKRSGFSSLLLMLNEATKGSVEVWIQTVDPDGPSCWPELGHIKEQIGIGACDPCPRGRMGTEEQARLQRGPRSSWLGCQGGAPNTPILVPEALAKSECGGPPRCSDGGCWSCFQWGHQEWGQSSSQQTLRPEVGSEQGPSLAGWVCLEVEEEGLGGRPTLAHKLQEWVDNHSPLTVKNCVNRTTEHGRTARG